MASGRDRRVSPTHTHMHYNLPAFIETDAQRSCLPKESKLPAFTCKGSLITTWKRGTSPYHTRSVIGTKYEVRVQIATTEDGGQSTYSCLYFAGYPRICLGIYSFKIKLLLSAGGTLSFHF